MQRAQEPIRPIPARPGKKAAVADATGHEKLQTVHCVARVAQQAGAAVAWVVPPAMSRQTSLFMSDPRQGVKKNLSEISERKGVWPPGGKLGMENRKPPVRFRRGRATREFPRVPESSGDTIPVRREPCQALVFSGCNSHPATGSLQPVAIGAAVEETKPSEPSRKMCRLGDAATRPARPGVWPCWSSCCWQA